MGAVFAAAAHAPITSVIILFELTGDYTIILPLMTAIAVSAGVSALLTSETIYTLKLRRRGIDVRRGRAASVMDLVTVGRAMRPVPQPLTTSASMGDVVDRLIEEGVEALPVVDDAGTYIGIVTADGTEERMRTNVLDAKAGDLAQHVPAVRADETLEQALELLLAHGTTGLPVLDTGDGRVIGWLTHHDVLRAYSGGSAVDRGGRPSAGREGAATVVPRPAIPAGGPGPSWLEGFRIVDLEFTLDEPPVGLPVAALPWPSLAVPIMIRREGLRFAPTAATILQLGDRVTVLVERGLADSLADILVQPRMARPASEDLELIREDVEEAPGDAAPG
jgi:chloride channel protein, CIC family